MSEHSDLVFERLRALMLEAASSMYVAKDGPGSLELRTHVVDPKTKELGWFGAVMTKKTYVAVHLMPLYLAPELAADCSSALAKRRQGKTCFNFTRVDETLFTELSLLARRCATAQLSG